MRKIFYIFILGALNVCMADIVDGEALIVDKKLKPTEQWINKEIDQMTIDADNIVYYNFNYWLPAISAEINNGYSQMPMHTNFLLENKKQVQQLRDKNQNKCVEAEMLTRKIEAQIQALELSLISLSQNK